MNNRDLSETAITDLPTRGLSDLEILRLVNTQSLKEIPSVYHYKVRHFFTVAIYSIIYSINEQLFGAQLPIAQSMVI